MLICIQHMSEQPGFCLIFILSKDKGIQSGTLLKMPISFLFHGKILPRYSEINKFKDLTFQK